MRRVLAFAGGLAVPACLACSPLPSEPERPAQEQRVDAIEHTLEVTRLACVAYSIKVELEQVEPQPEADAVCRVLLK